MQFYTKEKIGPTRSITPEGFLLIRGTPIARTGTQLYGSEETPVEAGPDGIVRIAREDDEVFRPETVASASGKPLVDEHPEDDVTPKTWKELALGTMFNPMRGTGVDDDLLLADILITDQGGIDLVNSGKTELSCGYDAQYEQTSPGYGRQHTIVINHVALVDNGRCGARCSIGDKAMPKVTYRDRLNNLFKVRDRAELDKALDEAVEGAEGEENMGEGEHTHIHLHGVGNRAEGANAGGLEEDSEEEMPPWFKKHSESVDARFKALDEKMGPMLEKWARQEGEEPAHAGDNKEIEGELEEEAPEGTGDKARKARDSAYLVDSFQDTAATAEILVPGISIPTFDAAANPKKSHDAICALRRRTLDLAYGDPSLRGVIDDLHPGRTFDAKALPCATLRTTFRAVGAFQRRANNAGASRTGDVNQSTFVGGAKPIGAIKSIADLNRYHASLNHNK